MKKLAILMALIMMLGMLAAAHAEILPPHGEGQIGLEAIVLCESLTLRRDPRASAAAVATIPYGNMIILTGERQADGWAACVLGDAEDSPSGWVKTDYLAVDPARYRTEKSTPVYAWNDTSAPKVALLDSNVTLPILKDNGEWLIVSLRGATGWIHVPGHKAAGAAPSAAVETASFRQNGERFTDTIVMEGMEETVHYEHVVSGSIGFEMDYDYETFLRKSESNRETFISAWDNPQNPENYLEIRSSAESADAAAAAISEALSREYRLVEEPYALDHVDGCIRIEASEWKDSGMMADSLETFYIIPAPDGCRIARVHVSIEGSEGFGRRFAYMMNTFRVLDGQTK